MSGVRPFDYVQGRRTTKSCASCLRGSSSQLMQMRNSGTRVRRAGVYSRSMAVDIVVFGPHPDDIEIGLGATIARHTEAGYAVGLCDLTRGELSSNGTPERRRVEAEAASRVLGAAWRENLAWPDGGITDTPEQICSAVNVIRRHRPRAVAVPYWNDRHPDHRAASDVLTIAAFRGSLRRYDTGEAPWRVDWICYYFINDSVLPSFVIDVS